MKGHYRTIEIDELKTKYDQNNYNVVVFGTLEFGERVKNGLEGFGIRVSYFADNNTEKQHHIFAGLDTISAKEISSLKNPLVIIASFWYEAITEQMDALGVSEVYVLKECPVNTHEEMEEDRNQLMPYFEKYKEKKSDNVLVEIYGHIGDVIVKTGVCKTLMQKYGKEKVYFLVDETEQKNLSSYLFLISDHVIPIEKERFSKDKVYRMDILTKLNSKYFQFSYCLCNIEFFYKMRYINKFILNVDTVYFGEEGRYILDKDYRMLSEIMGEDVRKICEEHNTIREEIKKVVPDVKLPEKFIVVSMGAANQMRRYPAAKFKIVFEYLLQQNYTMVFLGHGNYDEAFFKELVGEKDYGMQVHNLISCLSIIESMAVIARCQFFVGTDSGMCHAAFVLGKKSVVIYGKGDWGHFMHPSENVYYAYSRKERCSHCKYWDCTKEMRINGVSPCVESIEPEDIIEQIKKAEIC